MEALCPDYNMHPIMSLFRVKTSELQTDIIVDVDIAFKSTNLAKYNILAQASASMIAQANSSMDMALMLLR